MSPINIDLFFDAKIAGDDAFWTHIAGKSNIKLHQITIFM